MQLQSGDSLLDGFRIGEHAIQPKLGRIASPAGEAHVEPRAMDVLVALARRSGETVSRDDLINEVWKHPYVSDEALSRCISMLRHALGDDRSQARYVETIPKRGYRLVTPVEDPQSSAATNGPPASPSRQTKATPDWTRTNILLQPTPIIGRESELAELRALLAVHRLVTLTGSGGVGKTRLALEVASQSVNECADGVWLIELAPVSDPDAIAGMVAAALGVKLGPARALQDLVKGISGRNVLLVLDNCEHLIDSVAAFSETLLGAVPGARLLATSQTLVGIAGEQTYPLSPLSVPDGERLAADQVISATAVQLFVERAKLADPHFHLVDGNAAAVAAICRRLDGIPLAIEMAAARTPMLGVEQLAQLLDERFRVLTGGRRTALSRQQTLRATLDWSFALLSERERTVFSRLAAFVGGFTLEAASAVASDDVIDEFAVVDLLTRLIARSLVVADSSASGTRYRLLETTRVYALEQLKKSPDGDQTRSRHLDFYLALAEEARPELFRAEQGIWITRLDLERENVLAAHAWCDRTGMGAKLGLRLAYALKPYWFKCGLLGLGHRVTVEALARAGAAERDLARCRALLDAGQLCGFMSRHPEAQRYLLESLGIAREIGDKERAGAALRLLGIATLEMGDPATAQQYLEESLCLARELDNKHRLGDALNAIAEFHRRQGNNGAAEVCLQEGLDLSRELGELEGVSILLADLAMVAISHGSGERATGLLEEALAVAVRSGSKWAGQLALTVSAGMAAYFKEWRLAARLYGAAKAQHAHMGADEDPGNDIFLLPLLARTRGTIGHAAFAAAETEGALLSYDAALAAARSMLQEGVNERRGELLTAPMAGGSSEPTTP